MKIRRLPEIHIEGYKEMSISEKSKEYLNPKSVYLPTSIPVELVIKKNPGDHVLLGEEVMTQEGRFGHPVLSPISGTVKGIVKRWHHSNKMVPMMEIENDFKEELIDTFKGLKPEEMSRADLIKVMKDSGLVGMGGAGFPAYAKYETKTKVDMVIINLAECEPFITCDYTSVMDYTETLIYGLRYLLKAADSDKGIIAIKEKKMNEPLVEKLMPLLDANMEIRFLKDVYPAGWERYTVETISKKTYKILPIEAGVIVSNASTTISFAETLKYGIPPSKKYVTFTGDSIKSPGNVLCKIGTNITDLLPLFGGLKDGIEAKDCQIIAGGPMTGVSMFFEDFVTSHTLGAVILLEDKLKGKKTPECLGCGRCAEYCPVFLSPVEIRRVLAIGDAKELESLGVMKCIACGLCSFVCPSRLELTDAVTTAKNLVRRLKK